MIFPVFLIFLFVPGVFCRQHFVGHLVSRTISIRWKGVYDLTEIWKDWWKLFIHVNSDLSEIHKNNSGFCWTVGLSVTTVCGQDDDIFCIQLSQSSSGGERVRGNTQVPGSRSSHRTLGPKSHARGQTQRSTPARSQGGDVAGKYGVQASAKDFEATPLGPNPPPGDSTLGTLSNDRSPRSESKRPVETSGNSTLGTLANDRSPRSESKRPMETPGNSTLGTLLNYRSPRSESKRPVERLSSCDTGHNAWLATKGSVQQSSVNRPVYSEHVPVTVQ